MQFEQCEIRANRYGSLTVEHEFVAEVLGPHGSYVAARTPRFAAFEPNLKNTLFYPSHGVDQPDDTQYQRQFFNALVSFLVHIGWEPLAASGSYWFSRRFQRSSSLYIPDPQPATPYTLGDGEAWRKKALKALDQYERRGDAKSCRELADALLQLGLALEREHQLQEALTTYLRAGQMFVQISSTAEAEKASQWAARVLSHMGK